MSKQRKVSRDRQEHQTPEPEEQTTYKSDTTVTSDASPRTPGPAQELGTSKPHD